MRGSEHMGGVAPLPPPGLYPAAVMSIGQNRIKYALLSTMRQQAGPKFAQHGVTETGIHEFQSQRVFPVDAGAHGISCLAVG
jgi:hypothetical protein